MDDLGQLITKNFLESAITPVAKEVGDRLADVVNLVFTPIIMLRKYRDIKMEVFFEDLEKKVREIPEDKIMNPPLHIVGPALDNVAQFYYEEDYLREMFASLIASSLNKDTWPKVHPAFIEVIKQLSVVDAIILNSDYLFDKSDEGRFTRPICDLAYYNEKIKQIVGYAGKNIVFIHKYFKKITSDQFDFSLQNLLRLDLIKIDINEFPVFESMYEAYLSDDFLKRYEMFRGDTIYSSENISLKLIKKELALSDFGYDFILTCLKKQNRQK